MSLCKNFILCVKQTHSVKDKCYFQFGFVTNELWLFICCKSHSVKDKLWLFICCKTHSVKDTFYFQFSFAKNEQA